jgi:hypothetical protein
MTSIRDYEELQREQEELQREQEEREEREQFDLFKEMDIITSNPNFRNKSHRYYNQSQLDRIFVLLVAYRDDFKTKLTHLRPGTSKYKTLESYVDEINKRINVLKGQVSNDIYINTTRNDIFGGRQKRKPKTKRNRRSTKKTRGRR